MRNPILNRPFNINKMMLASLLAILSFLVSCGNNEKNKLAKNIKVMEDTLFSETHPAIDMTMTTKLVDTYIEYADKYPNDSLAPVYLFKAGDIAMNLLDPNKAIQIFDRILTEYPTYEKTPHCLFLKGFIYENELKNLEMARQIYQEFLAKYPTNEFADDVKISLDNLGKSPEELIKEFQEKAKADSLQ
jgi:outer membrane protein assembly factor BamD (BamD/ComL family)